MSAPETDGEIESNKTDQTIEFLIRYLTNYMDKGHRNYCYTCF